MLLQSGFCIAENHPSLAGHFPADPLVPGAVILDEVASIIAMHYPAIEVCKISNAKFRQPLRAGQQVVVEIELLAEDSIRFSCMHGDTTIATGRFSMCDKVAV